jgi:hypothetical protein
MQMIRSPKRRFELELHNKKFQETSIIDTAVKASEKTVFFDHKYSNISSDITVALA